MAGRRNGSPRNGGKQTQPLRAVRRPRVALIYSWITRYRAAFNEALRNDLDSRGIELSVIYGQPHPEVARRQLAVTLDWAERIENRFLSVGRKHLVWQPALRLVRDADLMVVQQQTRDLLIYPLFAEQVLGRQRLAFWGHGRNMDSATSSGLGESIKRQMSRHVHWWFAYNDYSADLVRQLGFPRGRITVVRNAIDTRTLIEQAALVTPADLAGIRDLLGLDTNNIAIYCGAMYDLKRLPFLVNACKRIRELVHDFHVLFIGTGPDAHVVAQAAAEHPWIHELGPLFGEQTLPYFKLAKLLLMPGGVGLVTLDSFALQTPLVTIDHDRHGVEIDYLTHDRDSVILPRDTDVHGYASAVAELLQDDARRQRLVDGCQASAREYSIEQMAARFGAGLQQALQAPSRALVRR